MVSQKDRCILISCSDPLLPGQGIARLASGDGIHIDCVFQWQRTHEPLRPVLDEEDDDD